MNEERFSIHLTKHDENHSIFIKDELGGNEICIKGDNDNLKENLEDMKKINFLLNMFYDEVINLKNKLELIGDG